MNNNAELNRKLFLATTEKQCHECAKFKSKITGYRLTNFWCKKNRNVVSGCDRLAKLMHIIDVHNTKISIKRMSETIEKIVEEACKRQLRVNRPVRDTIINKDDFLNLKIALNTSESITEFCLKV